ncbi:probable endochitinase [Anopheles albimanus]|uniref:probable endochitinase n=1 Tax=Anopheles albimanus TaxID=7167 RepID=UPI001641668C|nr:probable endochitinase [Anopheles albimanus]
MRIVLIAGLLLISISSLYAATDRVVCYFGSWATYRTGNGKFEVENIDPTLCTHIVYTFVGLDTKGNVKILDSWLDISLSGYSRFVQLKQRNPSVKLFIAIGGWNEGSATYSTMANSDLLRAVFVESTVAFVKRYGFDGFDVDWEYPTLRGGAPEDRVGFIKLLRDLRARFDQEGLLLSIATAATEDYLRSAYNVPEINRYVHFVNLMSYDLHAYWDGQTGANAPLYANTWETGYTTSMLNVDDCVRAWIDGGLDPAKLNVGVPVYGHTFKLSSTTDTRVGAPTVGPGDAGPYTLEPGTLSYLEICEKLKAGGYTTAWHEQQQVPYAYKGNQWISYDNARSIAIKVQYAKQMKVGGIMVWSIESDDAKGVCGEGAHPITATVYREVFGSGGAGTTTTTTARPATTTTTARPATTTTAPIRQTTTTVRPAITTTTAGTTLVCPASGFLRDPTNCAQFYQCYPGLNAFNRSSRFIPDTVFCYFNNDATFRVGNGTVTVDDINPALCTHVVYNAITLTSTGTIQLLDSYTDVTNGGFARLLALRQRHPAVAFLIGCGGAETSSKMLSKLMSTDVLRRDAISSIMNFLLNEYTFDGLDFNWQYPVLKGGNPEDRFNFITFLKELSANLHMYNRALSLTVAPTSDYFRSSYDVPSIAQYVDFISIQAFDLHAFWSGRTGHQAPMHPRGDEITSYEAEQNTDSIVSAWLTSGAPAAKLLLGVTANVNTIKLLSAADNGVGARTAGRGKGGPYTLTDGLMSYHELCEAMAKGGWVPILDRTQMAYYVTAGDQWMTYDDPRIIEQKASYIVARGLGGVALFNAENDDVRNYCRAGNYPLLRSINQGLSRKIEGDETLSTKQTTPTTTTTTTTRTTTTMRPVTTTTTRVTIPITTTKAPTNTVTFPTTCPDNGYYVDPSNCGVYYRCIPRGVFVSVWKYTCPQGLYFNTIKLGCDYPANVRC